MRMPSYAGKSVMRMHAFIRRELAVPYGAFGEIPRNGYRFYKFALAAEMGQTVPISYGGHHFA